MSDQSEKKGKLSRRGFIKQAAVTAGTVAIGGLVASGEAAPHRRRLVGGMGK